MLAARRLNDRGAIGSMRLALGGSLVLACLGGTAGFLGPWSAGMAPEAHVYPAIVWTLVGWTLAHVAVGIVMQAYCVARSLAGRLAPSHDIDLQNVVLYWHFLLVTAVIAFAVVGLFPLTV
jgi:cytochrome c oxidase subunit I+III